MEVALSLSETLDPVFEQGKETVGASKSARRIIHSNPKFSRVAMLRHLVTSLRKENEISIDAKSSLIFPEGTDVGGSTNESDKKCKCWKTLRAQLQSELKCYMSRNTHTLHQSMTVHDVEAKGAVVTSDAKIRVAYFPDPVKSQSSSDDGYAPSIAASLKTFGITLLTVSKDDICSGKLTIDKYDCILVPGGYAPNYCKALGKVGKGKIREFVNCGGGYIGICAGAYLATSCAKKRARSGGLDLLPDVSVMDYEHWARGRSDDCVIKLQAAGLGLLCGRSKPEHLIAGETIVTRYCNGPLLVVAPTVVSQINSTFPPLLPPSSASATTSSSSTWTPTSVPSSSSESIATFMSDFTNLAVFGKKILKPTGFTDLPRGIMNKTSAIVRGVSGKGRVILISPHLEDGEPLAKALLRSCVRWCAGSAVNTFERDRVDVPNQTRHIIRSAWLAARVRKYSVQNTDEDRAQALRILLASSGSVSTDSL